MNLTLERASALSALARVVGVVERKNTIAILGNLALSTDGEVLQVRATDLDMEAIERVPATVEAPGEITIPADKLNDIVRSSDPGSQILLALEDADPRMKVRSGRSNFKVPVLPIADFPTFNAEGLGPEFVIQSKTLADMFSRTSWAIAKMDSAQSAICNVFFGTRKGELHAAGCSTFGIALRREPLPERADFEAILTPKFVNQAIRWLADAEGDIFVSTSPNLIRLRHAWGTLTGRLFDWPSRFPSYEDILVENHDLTASTDQDAFKLALQRANIMNGDKGHAVRLVFNDGALTIQAKNDQSGEGADEVAVDYDAEPTSLLLSPTRLGTALSHLRGDRVEVAFAPAIDKSQRSIIVVVKAPADPSFVVNITQPRA